MEQAFCSHHSLRRLGQGLGAVLLLEALFRARRQSTRIGALAVIVDAIDGNARGFYEHLDFQVLEDCVDRLYLPMATIATLVTRG